MLQVLTPPAMPAMPAQVCALSAASAAGAAGQRVPGGAGGSAGEAGAAIGAGEEAAERPLAVLAVRACVWQQGQRLQKAPLLRRLLCLRMLGYSAGISHASLHQSNMGLWS